MSDPYAYWRDHPDRLYCGHLAVNVEDINKIIYTGTVEFDHNPDANPTTILEEENKIYKQVIAKLASIIRDMQDAC